MCNAMRTPFFHAVQDLSGSLDIIVTKCNNDETMTFINFMISKKDLSSDLCTPHDYLVYIYE